MKIARLINRSGLAAQGLEIGLKVHNFYGRIYRNCSENRLEVFRKSSEIITLAVNLLNTYYSISKSELDSDREGSLKSSDWKQNFAFASIKKRLKRDLIFLIVGIVFSNLESPLTHENDLDQNKTTDDQSRAEQQIPPKDEMGEHSQELKSSSSTSKNYQSFWPNQIASLPSSDGSSTDPSENEPKPRLHFVATAVMTVAMFVLLSKERFVLPLFSIGGAFASSLVLRFYPDNYEKFRHLSQNLTDKLYLIAAPHLYLMKLLMGRLKDNLTQESE